MQFSLYRERGAKNTLTTAEMRQRVNEIGDLTLLNPAGKGRFLLLEADNEKSLRTLKSHLPSGWTLEKNEVHKPMPPTRGPQPF